MHGALNDNDLIAAFHEGKAAAYESIYIRFARSLRFFIGRVVTDDMAADDITVETLTKAFTRHRDFPSIEKLKAFLFITAGNAALDHIRTATRHRHAYDQLRHQTEGQMTDLEMAYLTTEATRAVHAAIDTLPDRPKQVITMIFFEGRKLAEIAQALSISYNTVQEYRARGLQMLRMRLQNNELLPATVLVIALSLLEQQ